MAALTPIREDLPWVTLRERHTQHPAPDPLLEFLATSDPENTLGIHTEWITRYRFAATAPAILSDKVRAILETTSAAEQTPEQKALVAHAHAQQAWLIEEHPKHDRDMMWKLAYYANDPALKGHDPSRERRLYWREKNNDDERYRRPIRDPSTPTAEGGFSIVYLTPVDAIKRITFEKRDVMLGFPGEFLREVAIAHTLKSDAILPVTDVVDTHVDYRSSAPFAMGVSIVTPRALGDLWHMGHRVRNWKAVALALAEGIECLHTQGVLHRDLKSPNVFLMEGEKPVLADFGQVVYLRGDDVYRSSWPMDASGTVEWSAPEQLVGWTVRIPQTPQNGKVDVYAYGWIVWDLWRKSTGALRGERPYYPNMVFRAASDVKDMDEKDYHEAVDRGMWLAMNMYFLEGAGAEEVWNRYKRWKLDEHALHPESKFKRIFRQLTTSTNPAGKTMYPQVTTAFLQWGNRPHNVDTVVSWMSVHANRELADILAWCWDPDPGSRPTMQELTTKLRPLWGPVPPPSPPSDEERDTASLPPPPPTHEWCLRPFLEFRKKTDFTWKKYATKWHASVTDHVFPLLKRWAADYRLLQTAAGTEWLRQFTDRPPAAGNKTFKFKLWVVQTWAVYAGDILVRWYDDRERTHPVALTTACLVALKLVGRIDALRLTLRNVAIVSEVNETALWLEEQALLYRSKMQFPLQPWDHPTSLPPALQTQLSDYFKTGSSS